MLEHGDTLCKVEQPAFVGNTAWFIFDNLNLKILEWKTDVHFDKSYDEDWIEKLWATESKTKLQ